MTVPIWACTGGYQIGPDRVEWIGGRPMRVNSGVAGMYGPQPAFEGMVGEDLYGHEIGFRCYGRGHERLQAMQDGDLYG